MESTFFSFASGVDLFGLGMKQAGHKQVGHAEVDKWSNWLAEEFALKAIGERLWIDGS